MCVKKDKFGARRVNYCGCFSCVCARRGHPIDVYKEGLEEGILRRIPWASGPRCDCGRFKGFEAAVKLASDERIRDG